MITQFTSKNLLRAAANKQKTKNINGTALNVQKPIPPPRTKKIERLILLTPKENESKIKELNKTLREVNRNLKIIRRRTKYSANKALDVERFYKAI